MLEFKALFQLLRALFVMTYIVVSGIIYKAAFPALLLAERNSSSGIRLCFYGRMFVGNTIRNFYTCKKESQRRRNPGLFIADRLVTLWSAGSLMELLSPTEQGMLFWRNFEQIGVFLLPVFCVYFAVEYARYDRMKKYLPLLLIVPIIAILLIFTDSKTHVMRYGYIVSYSPLFGKALSVHSTPVGKAFVAYNYTLAFSSLLILFLFSRQIAKNMRRQVILVMVATGLIFLFGLLKTAFLEGSRINFPIVTIYLPGSLVLCPDRYKQN